MKNHYISNEEYLAFSMDLVNGFNNNLVLCIKKDIIYINLIKIYLNKIIDY